MTLAAAAAARADTLTVTGTGEDAGPCTAGVCPSIRSALSQAAALPGADTITVPAGDYVLSSALTVGSDVTLRGASARTTIVHGGDNYRVFEVAARRHRDDLAPDDARRHCGQQQRLLGRQPAQRGHAAARPHPLHGRRGVLRRRPRQHRRGDDRAVEPDRQQQRRHRRVGLRRHPQPRPPGPSRAADRARHDDRVQLCGPDRRRVLLELRGEHPEHDDARARHARLQQRRRAAPRRTPRRRSACAARSCRGTARAGSPRAEATSRAAPAAASRCRTTARSCRMR